MCDHSAGYVTGNRPGCAQSKSHSWASSHCRSNGGRLCTRAEIKSGLAQGTGCSHDSRLVWTADKCEEKVVTKCDRVGCHQAKTWDEASDICAGQSKSLCSQEAIESGSGQGTGCSHDSRHVWTSTTC